MLKMNPLSAGAIKKGILDLQFPAVKLPTASSTAVSIFPSYFTVPSLFLNLLEMPRWIVV